MHVDRAKKIMTKKENRNSSYIFAKIKTRERSHINKGASNQFKNIEGRKLLKDKGNAQ